MKVIRELRTEIQRLKSIIASGDLVRTQDNLSDLHNDYTALPFLLNLQVRSTLKSLPDRQLKVKEVKIISSS